MSLIYALRILLLGVAGDVCYQGTPVRLHLARLFRHDEIDTRSMMDFTLRLDICIS